MGNASSNIEKFEQRILELENENKKLEDETSKYQSKLGIATNIKPDDGESVQLNNDILSLQDKIDNYVTALKKSKVDVKTEEIINLLSFYECRSNNPDKEMIRAILKRHVLETIFGFSKDYFSCSGDDNYLESDVVGKTDELCNLMEKFSDTRDGIDERTKVAPIKLRQQIYAVLGIRGLGKITEGGSINTHKSITNFAEDLNNSMNKCRIIKDPREKERIDNSAEIIVQEVFRIFYFRLKVQEPVAHFHWFKHGDKVNKTIMETSCDDDDLVVELCTFPLVGVGPFTDSNLSNLKVFTRAKIIIGKSLEDEKHDVDDDEENYEEEQQIKVETSIETNNE